MDYTKFFIFKMDIVYEGSQPLIYIKLIEFRYINKSMTKYVIAKFQSITGKKNKNHVFNVTLIKTLNTNFINKFMFNNLKYILARFFFQMSYFENMICLVNFLYFIKQNLTLDKLIQNT